MFDTLCGVWVERAKGKGDLRIWLVKRQRHGGSATYFRVGRGEESSIRE